MLHNTINLYDWISIWLETYSKIKIKDSTYTNYLYCFKKIRKYIENKNIKEIQEIELQLSINRMALDGMSMSYIKKIILIFSCSFSKAYKNNIVNFNVAEDLTLPFTKQPKKIISLTISEQKKIEQFCENSLLGYLIIFLLNTGLRRSELIDLKWENYNEKNQEISIVKSKTSSGVRIIPLLPITNNIIKRQDKINEYIFNNTKKNKITASCLKKLLIRIRKETNIYITNHICRHTFATRLCELGATSKTVSTILGHSTVNFTLNNYVTSNTEQLHKEIRLLI